MSKRHHVIAFVLLSSSAAFASPALTDEARLAAAQRASAVAARAELVAFVEARFQTLRDGDGYPLVGNMHGKSGDDEVTSAVAEAPLVVADRTACETAIQLALASE